MPSKLFLFDMDGVLFDTMPQHVRSWKQTADEYGLEAKQDEFYLYEGMRGIDTIAKLYHRTFGKEAPMELVEEIYERKTALFNNANFELQLIPYTREVMAVVKEKGYDIAVVTGSTQNNAYPRIEKYYSDYVKREHIITAESVTKGKPNPEPYLMGMKLFGCSPEEAIVIENAPLGVKSGSSAGALTIAVTTGPIKESILREEGAQLVFPDMKALQIWCQKKL